jgi:hypothetical protein
MRKVLKATHCVNKKTALCGLFFACYNLRMSKTIVTDEGKAIATIHFEDGKLIVRAASQEEADNLLKSLARPYNGWRTWKMGEVSLIGAVLLYPGTPKHYRQLGGGKPSMDLLPNPDKEKIRQQWWIEMKNITLPTFEFQAEYHRPPEVG